MTTFSPKPSILSVAFSPAVHRNAVGVRTAVPVPDVVVVVVVVRHDDIFQQKLAKRGQSEHTEIASRTILHHHHLVLLLVVVIVVVVRLCSARRVETAVSTDDGCGSPAANPARGYVCEDDSLNDLSIFGASQAVVRQRDGALVAT